VVGRTNKKKENGLDKRETNVREKDDENINNIMSARVLKVMYVQP
jgi:hypothetical protein